MKRLPYYPALAALMIVASPLAKEVTNTAIKPPILVECKPDATCDRDPMHLEKFVTGLYRWYVDSEVRIYHIHPALRRMLAREEKQKKLDTMLTPSFAGFIEDQIQRAQKGDYEALDSDFILQGNDYLPEWASTAYSKTLSVNDVAAKITVYLPIPRDKNFFPPAPYCKVHVTLKPSAGAWRIASTGGNETDCSKD